MNDVPLTLIRTFSELREQVKTKWSQVSILSLLKMDKVPG